MVEDTEVIVEPQEFVDAIFDPEIIDSDERVVICMQPHGGAPGLPVGLDGLERHLARADRAKKGLGWYFGTSTVALGPDGVRNRRDAFVAAWCLVLDDVGTKVRAEDLPALFQSPSWIIESSEGNYQYGFIYDDPITDYAAAKTVLDQVVWGVGADSGGCMPCKLVRLPFGINAKKGEAGEWAVRLRRWSPDRLFSPDELLAAAGSSMSMRTLSTAPAGAIQSDPRRVAGTAAYRDVSYHSAGVVDDLAEWLVDRGLVVDDGGAWWEVLCPWRHEHSDGGGQTAGYSPLGAVGSMAPGEERRFKCFHEHCAGRGTRDFLWWAVDQGGPSVPVRDLAASVIAEWVLDASANSWVNIRTGSDVPDAGFRNLFQLPLYVPEFTPAGKERMRKVPTYRVVVESPSLIRTTGRRYEPGGGPLLKEGKNWYVNLCQLPSWPMVEPDMEVVGRFLDFVEYLIPDRGKSEWFLSHLAMKARDPKYRGNPVYMYTPASGTGRGTLVRLLSRLWGAANVRMPKYGELVDGVAGVGFNDSLIGLWACVAEIPARGRSGEGGWRGSVEFTELKNACDPAPIQMEFNRKYGAKWTDWWYASLLLCSNEPDGLAADRDDRRVVRIENTTSPRSWEWFKEFREWIEAGGWEPSVWSWLMERDLGGFKPGENLFLVEDEERMIQAAQQESEVDSLVNFAFEYIRRECGGFLNPRKFESELYLMSHQIRLSARQRESVHHVINKTMRRGSGLFKLDGEVYYMVRDGDERVKPRAVSGTPVELYRADGTLSDRCRDGLAGFDPMAMRDHVIGRFEELRPHLLTGL